jgi:hypothetical protein
MFKQNFDILYAHSPKPLLSQKYRGKGKSLLFLAIQDLFSTNKKTFGKMENSNQKNSD